MKIFIVVKISFLGFFTMKGAGWWFGNMKRVPLCVDTLLWRLSCHNKPGRDPRVEPEGGWLIHLRHIMVLLVDAVMERNVWDEFLSLLLLCCQE